MSVVSEALHDGRRPEVDKQENYAKYAYIKGWLGIWAVLEDGLFLV